MFRSGIPEPSRALAIVAGRLRPICPIGLGCAILAGMHDTSATLAFLALLLSSLFTLSPASTQAATLTSGPTSLAQAGYIYTIRPGDTLWDIAVAHGITLQALLEANELSDAATLHVGQTIRVPAPPPPPIAAPEPQPASPPGDEAPAEPSAPAPEAPVEPSAPAPEAPVVTIAPELADWPAAVLSLINARRAENGLPALAWSDQLAEAAQAHADDCARRNRGGHAGSDEAKLRARLARTGYEAEYASENWANARGVEHAVSMWWNESAGGPHRRNILSQNYTEIGIGVARGAWGFYFVVDFASR